VTVSRYDCWRSIKSQTNDKLASSNMEIWTALYKTIEIVCSGIGTSLIIRVDAIRYQHPSRGSAIIWIRQDGYVKFLQTVEKEF
jgi:hypothetical protein